jgi:hypothetical protein
VKYAGYFYGQLEQVMMHSKHRQGCGVVEGRKYQKPWFYEWKLNRSDMKLDQLLLYCCFQAGSGAHPASYQMGTVDKAAGA